MSKYSDITLTWYEHTMLTKIAQGGDSGMACYKDDFEIAESLTFLHLANRIFGSSRFIITNKGRAWLLANWNAKVEGRR